MLEIYNEDCIAGMKKIPDGSVDLVIADPPYGVTRLAYDTCIDMDAFFNEVWRVVKPNAAVLVFGVEPFSSKLRMSQLRHYRYDWIWEKTVATGFLNAHKRPLRAYEIISVFYKKQPAFNPQMTAVETTSRRRSKGGAAAHYNNYARDDYQYIDTGQRYPKDVLKVANPHGNNLPAPERKQKRHPSCKPVSLLSYLMQSYSHEGDTVLDPFAGGGQRSGCSISKSQELYRV